MMGQQTLIGEDYGLLSGVGDRSQDVGWVANVTARPNYFATLLHRRFVGDRVLNATITVDIGGTSLGMCVITDARTAPPET
jgi:hypothetical protein